MGAPFVWVRAPAARARALSSPAAFTVFVCKRTADLFHLMQFGAAGTTGLPLKSEWLVLILSRREPSNLLLCRPIGLFGDQIALK